MKKLFIQAFKFFGFSGLGWLLDMTIYIILTSLNFAETPVNMFSSLIAVSFVYVASTRKIFQNGNEKINLKKKYILYILYQLLVITISSLAIGVLAGVLGNINIEFISHYNSVLAKVLVTPVTMLTNFIFMKLLIEKV